MAADEDRVINTKLKTLKRAFERNEELMQEAAVKYEDLMAEKETLQLTMDHLRKSRFEVKQKKNGSG